MASATSCRDLLGKAHTYHRLGPDAYAERCKVWLDEIDSWPREWREFVHEYGFLNARSARQSGLSVSAATAKIQATRAQHFAKADREATRTAILHINL